MPSTSYSHRCKTAHAVGWSRAIRWILSVMSGFLLTLASAGAAHAATPVAHSATVNSPAADCAIVAAQPTSTPHGLEVFDGRPVRDSGHQCPLDSSDSWLEPDDDDEGSGDTGSPDARHLSVEEALGLRNPSASVGSLTPDGDTLANQFLTDSIRRM